MTFKLKPHQTVLTVTNLEKSAEFYSRFGFQIGQKIDKNDGRSRVTLISELCPDYELKLFTCQDPKPITPVNDLQEYLTTIGTRYMSLLCEDVDEFYEQWKEDIKFIYPPKTGMTGCRYVFILDPDGILVEIYQRNYIHPT